MKDPEKKAIYDKYGSEEEIRERQTQNQTRYYQDDIDPFDLFEMFFSGGSINQNRSYRRRGQRDQPQHHAHQEGNNNNNNVRANKFFYLIQLFPLITLLLFTFLPSLLQSFNVNFLIIN